MAYIGSGVFQSIGGLGYPESDYYYISNYDYVYITYNYVYIDGGNQPQYTFHGYKQVGNGTCFHRQINANGYWKPYQEYETFTNAYRGGKVSTITQEGKPWSSGDPSPSPEWETMITNKRAWCLENSYPPDSTTTIYVSVPLFNESNTTGINKYINEGDTSGADNSEMFVEKLYGKWTIGYTNSSDTVYSIACSAPQFYDINSVYYGLGNISKIRLIVDYKNYDRWETVLTTTFPYGETWNGKLSDLVKTNPTIASQIAKKVLDFLNLDAIKFTFDLVAPFESETGSVVTPQGYAVFDHADVESYGFLGEITEDTITFKSGVVLDDDDSDITNPEPDTEESDSESDPTLSDITGSGLLTKTYMLTPQEAQGIGSFLWGADFMQNIRLLNTSPIENVVSCKLFPFEVNGTNANVVIGNVDSLTQAQIISKNVIKKTSGVLTVSKFYSNQADNLKFLDYDPYTKVEIFLPFIGLKELPVDIVMGGKLKIQWWIDLVCGTVETHVLCDSPTDRGSNNSGYHTLMIFNSQCGVDIPLTAQNLAQVESAYIQNAIGGGVSLASGNIAGVVQSIAGAITTQYHSQTHGTPSPSTTVQTDLTPYIRITRPYAKINGSTNVGQSDENPCKAYRKLMGAPLYEVQNLGSLDGYTEVENPQIAVSGALKEEVDEINRLLAEGVILTKYAILGAQ